MTQLENRETSSQAPQQACLERVVPGEAPEGLYLQHLARYEFACGLVTEKDVLDVACGSGFGAPVLVAAGARSYTGVDISAEAVRMAETRFSNPPNTRFSCEDACYLPSVENASVDVAVSFETVEHLEDPTGFFRNLQRVLRPEGLLVISTPNRTLFSPGNTLESKSDNPYHVREWNQREFIELLSGFFSIEEVLGQALTPAWKAFLLIQGARRRWLRRLIESYVKLKRSGSSHGTARRDATKVQSGAEIHPLSRRSVPVYLVVVCRALSTGVRK